MFIYSKCLINRKNERLSQLSLKYPGGPRALGSTSRGPTSGLMGHPGSPKCYTKPSFFWLTHFAQNPATSSVSRTGASIGQGLQSHNLTQAPMSTVLCGHSGPEMHALQGISGQTCRLLKRNWVPGSGVSPTDKSWGLHVFRKASYWPATCMQISVRNLSILMPPPALIAPTGYISINLQILFSLFVFVEVRK